MRLTDLADHLRAAGLVVVEQPGWKQRGSDLPGKPDTILCHHTASPARAKGDLPTLRLLIEGRSDLPGPLCQLALSRSGVVHLIAGGKAQHAGRGAWKGTTSSAQTIGIEAEHPGGETPWTKVQYDAYVRLCAALCGYLGVGSERVTSHALWALPKGRKTDPNFDMTPFRAAVKAAMTKTTPPSSEDEVTDADLKKITDAFDAALAKAVKTITEKAHADAVVLLRGTVPDKDGKISHPFNIVSIGKAVGADQKINQP